MYTEDDDCPCCGMGQDEREKRAAQNPDDEIPTKLIECPFCYGKKCCGCDMGDDVKCLNCDNAAEDDEGDDDADD